MTVIQSPKNSIIDASRKTYAKFHSNYGRSLLNRRKVAHILTGGLERNAHSYSSMVACPHTLANTH
jgi:hypothetical protein